MSHKHTGNGQKQFVRVREALFRLAPKGVIQGQRQKKESFKGPIGRTMGIVELAHEKVGIPIPNGENAGRIGNWKLHPVSKILEYCVPYNTPGQGF